MTKWRAISMASHDITVYWIAITAFPLTSCKSVNL